jgi:hypothetical protein
MAVVVEVEEVLRVLMAMVRLAERRRTVPGKAEVEVVVLEGHLQQLVLLVLVQTEVMVVMVLTVLAKDLGVLVRTELLGRLEPVEEAVVGPTISMVLLVRCTTLGHKLQIVLMPAREAVGVVLETMVLALTEPITEEVGAVDLTLVLVQLAQAATALLLFNIPQPQEPSCLLKLIMTGLSEQVPGTRFIGARMRIMELSWYRFFTVIVAPSFLMELYPVTPADLQRAQLIFLVFQPLLTMRFVSVRR